MCSEVSSGYTTRIVNCIDDAPVDEAPVPSTSTDACTSCCSRSSMSRRLFTVAFETGVGVLFDSSFSLHSSVTSSSCLLFDFQSDSCGLHLLILHKWCPSIISPRPRVPGSNAMMTIAKQRSRAEVDQARQLFRKPLSSEDRKAKLDNLNQKSPRAQRGPLGHWKDDNGCPAKVTVVNWRRPKP